MVIFLFTNFKNLYNKYKNEFGSFSWNHSDEKRNVLYECIISFWPWVNYSLPFFFLNKREKKKKENKENL